ncbi:hypothetical protein BC830DRAFT_1127465 [Chytriomyces sp. MP71]|nr:hypothetical protein BC830DRAFT_1127465 [Chytriomyces sp. MP71]
MRPMLQEEVQVLHSPTNWMHAFSGASKEPETFFTMSPAVDDNCKTPTLLSSRSKTPSSAAPPLTPTRRSSFMVAESEHDSLASAIAAIMSSPKLDLGGTRRRKCNAPVKQQSGIITPVIYEAEEVENRFPASFGQCSSSHIVAIAPLKSQSLPNSPAHALAFISPRTSLDSLAIQPAGKLILGPDPVQKGRFTVRRI